MTQEAIIRKTLEIYCEWLNKWIEATDESNEHRYDPQQFLVFKPEDKLWGYTHVDYVIPLYHQLYILSVSDGDEGGPAILYVWVALDAPHGFRIVHINQEFDTNVQSIYDDEADPKFLRLP